MEEIRRQIELFEVPVGFEIPPEKNDRSFIRKYGVTIRQIENGTIAPSLSQRPAFCLWYCLCSRTCIRRKIHLRMYRNDASAARKHLLTIHSIQGMTHSVS